MYTSANSTQSLVPVNASNDRVAFDNLIRRELQVGDPSNAQEVADALLRRYKSDPRAQAIQREALGLPTLLEPSSSPVVKLVPTASDNEWKQAVDDVERDLLELSRSTLLKDVRQELNGWTQAIRSTLQAVDTSARFGLDPRQRDKTLSLRRQLSDYARFARLVGALTPDAGGIYRQLAMSLDEAAAMTLVRVGEALANAGFSGNYLLQAPYSELQTRRDAAVYALRSLIGATQQAYTPNEWPRGLNAYRRLYEALEQQGQGELRSLLVETELTRIMDELVQRAGDGSAEGLRAAGATAEIDLLRLRRLIATSRQLVRPESPPLTAFLEALQLFADGFSPAGGPRLLRIARPPLLMYGLYGSQGVMEADSRLLQLVMLRNQLADHLDCLAGSEGDTKIAQAALDLSLHGVDRAIDLYANGREDFGSAECRASALAYVLIAVKELLREDLPTRLQADRALLARSKTGISGDPSAARRNAMQALLDRIEVQLNDIKSVGDAIRPALAQRAKNLLDISVILDQLIAAVAPFSSSPRPLWRDSVRFITGDSIAIRHQELDSQLQLERSWAPLIGALTPVCPGDDLVVGASGVLERVLRRAAVLNQQGFDPTRAAFLPLFFLHDFVPVTSNLPPQYETLLDVLANDAGIAGENR